MRSHFLSVIFERLLDDDVLASTRCRHGRVHVHATRRGDGDDVDVIIVQHGVQPRVRLAVVVGGKLDGGVFARIKAGDELCTANVGDCPCVKCADHAAADDAEAVCHVGPFDWGNE